MENKNVQVYYNQNLLQLSSKLNIFIKYSGLETDKDNFKVAKMQLQKMILKKEKCYFEEELAKNGNKPKELWKALKSLGLSLDNARKSKIYLKRDGAIQFEALENANTFKGTQQMYEPNNQKLLLQDFMQRI